MPEVEASCINPECQTQRMVKESILSTKMNAAITIGLTGVGLLGYSVLWQAPQIDKRMVEQGYKLEQAIKDNADRISTLEKKQESTEKRLSKLEKQE